MVASGQNWLATPGWTQPLFPPVSLTNILQFATIKSFRNESFLREKYLDEGWSLDEIAAQTLSSKKTVRRYLIHNGISLRPSDQVINVPEKFGTRRVKGRLLPDTSEQAAIEKIKALRNQGCSYREIVKILNDEAVPCRKEGASWHVKTVYKAINRRG